MTDAWKVYRYAFHHSKKDDELPVHEFANRLAYELIHNNFEAGDSTEAKALSPLMKSPTRRSPRRHDLSVHFVADVSETANWNCTNMYSNKQLSQPGEKLGGIVPFAKTKGVGTAVLAMSIVAWK